MRFDRITAMLGTAWAIRPEALTALAEALDVLMAGGVPNVEAFAAAGSGAGDGGDDDTPYALVDQVAVVPVVGALVKRNSWFSCFNTYSDVQAMVSQALDDPRAAAVLLLIDSPGGSVDGCQELAEFLATAAGRKPLFAYADGQMTSAAYWLGSCAREIAAPPTAVVGSIGVVTVHHDRSGMDEKAGLKRTYLSAGRFKAAGHDAAPLSDEGRSVIQGFLDDTYAIFLRDVAKNRGLDLSSAETWADGKVFLAEAAKAAGLVDFVMGLDAFLGRIHAQIAESQIIIAGGQLMDLKQLKAEHPGLVAELLAEFETEAKAKAPDVATAVATERTGLLALVGAALGDQAGERVAALVAAGVSAEQVKAVSGVLGQAPAAPAAPDTKAQILAGLQAAAPDPVGAMQPAAPEKQQAEAVVSGLVLGLKGGR